MNYPPQADVGTTSVVPVRLKPHLQYNVAASSGRLNPAEINSVRPEPVVNNIELDSALV